MDELERRVKEMDELSDEALKQAKRSDRMTTIQLCVSAALLLTQIFVHVIIKIH